MTDARDSVFAALRSILVKAAGGLAVCKDTDTAYELRGLKSVTLGPKTVDGMYFASVVKAKKDVAFYFFPTYTHPAEIGALPALLARCRTGKSCFHVGRADRAILAAIRGLVMKGKAIYKKAAWI